MTEEKRPAERVLAMIDSEPWLITAAGLAKMREIASRENFVITAEDLEKIEQRREALAAKKAARLEGAYASVKRDGVAIIAVQGPIFRYADMFTAISGGATTESIAIDFNLAMNDPMIEAVLLTFDSPGGEVKGVNELANMIASRRADKPIGAYIGGDCGSAAYWIACAAEPGLVGIDATGHAGSIGSRVIVKKELPNEKTRSVAFEFISKQSPKKNVDPETESGQAYLQKIADSIGGVFVDTVAAMRGVSVEKVLADFGGGETLMGKEAVDAGLADSVTSMEAMIQTLKMRRRTGNYGKTPHAAARSTKEIASMYTPEMKAKIGLTATATDADVDAKLEQMQAAAAKLPDLETKLASEKEARITAETARLTAEATAQVETWQREGRISGNATAAVKEFYVGLMTADGKAITPEKFASVMAALPKVSTERIAETAKTTEEPEAKPTKADFHAYDKGDKTAAAKIDSFVKQIAAKDKSKKYAQHMQAVRAEALAAK